MFDLRKIPVLGVLVPFAAGSLAGYQLEEYVSVWDMIWISMAIWLILLLFYIIPFRKRGTAGLIFKVVAILLMLSTGYGAGMMTKPEDPGLPLGEPVMIMGEVREPPVRREQNWMLDMRLSGVVSSDAVHISRTHLKVYLDMPADSILPAVGETWWWYGQLVPIRNSGNPNEPDYEAIMQRKNCWYRFFTDSRVQVGMKVCDPRESRFSAVRIRESVSAPWKGNLKAVSLLKAVCLGDRSGLTDDMQQSYKAAGGMHLLAVSGLHVGLIWWVLHHALGWIVRILRKEVFRALTIMLLLWFYAYLTGFSSSVCRSVTMFSLVTVSRVIDQRTSPLNAILVSAFVLIYIHPGRMMDVGFQLSYAAITGIVLLYPVIRKLLKVNNKIVKWIWEATVVSLSAQIATMPLVVYYFHQLPVYALLTNLLAVPLLSGLIAVFVISVPFTAIGIMTQLFNGVLITMSSLMNRSMELIASIPGAVMGELYLDRSVLIILLTTILMVMISLNSSISLPRYLIMCLIAYLLFHSAWIRYNRSHTSEIVVSHCRGCSLISFREGYLVEHYRWCRDSTLVRVADRISATFWDSRRYRVRFYALCDSISVEGAISRCIPLGPGLWLIGNDGTNGWIMGGTAGQLPLSLPEKYPVDFILLSAEPRSGLLYNNSMTNQCDWILDGSNRAWYVRRMQDQQVPLHITDLHGAYMKRR